MSNRVVAHCRDGRIIKGLSRDVDPAKATCHISSPSGTVSELALGDVKALYFVRNFSGDPGRHESTTLQPTDPRLHGSLLVTLYFDDGEKLVGLAHRGHPKDPFFFLVPVDRGSNNIRVLVNRTAVVSIETPGAGEMRDGKSLV
jgi:hypothetical protein